MHMRNTIVCALLVFGTQYAWGQSACQQALTNIQKLNSQASQPGMPSSDVAAFRQSAQVYQNFYNANCQGRSGTSSGFGSVPSGSNARLNALQGILGNMANMAATLQASQERQEAEARQRQMQAEFDQMEREQQERQRKLETQRETAAAEHRAREAARAAEIAKAEADRQEALAATEDARQRNVDVKFGDLRPAGSRPENNPHGQALVGTPFLRGRPASASTGNGNSNATGVTACPGYPSAKYLSGSPDCFLENASPQQCSSLGGHGLYVGSTMRCFFVPPKPDQPIASVPPLTPSPFFKSRTRTSGSPTVIALGAYPFPAANSAANRDQRGNSAQDERAVESPKQCTIEVDAVHYGLPLCDTIALGNNQVFCRMTAGSLKLEVVLRDSIVCPDVPEIRNGGNAEGTCRSNSDIGQVTLNCEKWRLANNRGSYRTSPTLRPEEFERRRAEDKRRLEDEISSGILTPGIAGGALMLPLESP